MTSVGDGWSVPEEVTPGGLWSWVHIRPGSALRLVVTSESPVWYAGHFVNGRMRPCPGRECGYCEKGVGVQVRFVFGVARMDDRREGLIELGQSVANVIKAWIPRRGSLRGMVLCFGRYSASRQSRIEVEYCEESMPDWLGECRQPDLRAALELTWVRERTAGGNGAGSGGKRQAPPSLKDVRSPSG